MRLDKGLREKGCVAGAYACPSSNSTWPANFGRVSRVHTSYSTHVRRGRWEGDGGRTAMTAMHLAPASIPLTEFPRLSFLVRKKQKRRRFLRELIARSMQIVAKISNVTSTGTRIRFLLVKSRACLFASSDIFSGKDRFKAHLACL